MNGHFSLILALLIAQFLTTSESRYISIAFAEDAKALDETSTRALELEQKRERRHQFLAQDLITAKPREWIFQSGQIPRIVWRDVEEVRRLGFKGSLRVRWFDRELNESDSPGRPGRWLAWIEGTAPNGTPFRRAMTFYVLPKDIELSFTPDLTVAFPHFPGPKAPAILHEHQAELSRVAGEIVVDAILDSERGAILMAGIAESKPLGRPARFAESASVLNEDAHLALKLKLQGLQQRVRPLQPPRRREAPAPVLHHGSLAEAGMLPDAKERIDRVCRDWAEQTGEPFVTLVARNGVIVTHEAFGNDPYGNPISRDYRCWVASITKTITSLLFSRFLDQGLIGLDDSLSTVFPDYPKNDPHVPTFRQCFTHTSGLSGHGDYGGMRNPHLENIILNALDVNEPGVTYAYSGQGFELAVKAMEIVAGQSAVRLYDEHLFGPLGFSDVPIGNASSEGRFTAMELGVMAQWIANRGSYGDSEFISQQTFEKLLPEPLRVADRGFTEDEGIGMHWVRHLKPGAMPGSKREEDLLFSPRTVGHGSFSGCVFVIDPVQQLVITQVRKESGGASSAAWSARFFETIAAAIKSDPDAAEPMENSIGLKLVRVPAGEFIMGSPETEKGRRQDEPQRRVKLTRSFDIGQFEVTRGQFRQFVDATKYRTDVEGGTRGGYGVEIDQGKLAGPDKKYSWRYTGFPQTDEHPVVNVTFNDAQAFCDWLSRKENAVYRLPTEAEWEYASRAGSQAAFCYGDDSEKLVEFGNIVDKDAKAIFADRIAVSGSDGSVFTASVGSYQANAFGLHDLHGNVWEWTADWFGPPPTTDQVDPRGPATGTEKVIRGGDWYHDWSFARCAQRFPMHPTLYRRHAGFRVVRETEGKQDGS